MTTKRRFLLATAGLLLTRSLGAEAQPATKVFRVAYIGTNPPIHPAFLQGMRQAGYAEGRNLVIDSRHAEGKRERFPEFITEAIRLKADVLVCISTTAALAARKITTTVPVVFASVFDPVGAGVVPNLARPGGNITGASTGHGGSGFDGKWVELLKEAVPGLSTLAVLAYPAEPNNAVTVADIRTAAKALNVKVDVHNATNPAELDQAFAAMAAGRPQGLIMTRSLFFTANRHKIIQFAAARRVPALYSFQDFVTENGGFMAYTASQAESFRNAAELVDRILKGDKPGDLPVRQPTRYELAINMRAAKALGITLPQSLLVRADHVIQ
jgi:putative ABC transport system substrate-binding protein